MKPSRLVEAPRDAVFCRILASVRMRAEAMRSRQRPTTLSIGWPLDSRSVVESISCDNNSDWFEGLQEPLSGRQVVDWIGLGGVAEDQFDGNSSLVG